MLAAQSYDSLCLARGYCPPFAAAGFLLLPTNAYRFFLKIDLGLLKL